MKSRITIVIMLAFFGIAAVAIAGGSAKFNQVKADEFDPAKTYLVQAEWVQGIGCPTAARTSSDGENRDGTYTDAGCPTGDESDRKVEGLLLAKTGPTANVAAAVAELKNVKGITLTELGYDIRKFGAPASPVGSHCGAGAPRFNVTTQDGVTHFVGCNSPAPVVNAAGPGWTRLRYNPATAFPPILPSDKVKSIVIVFDEGQDASGAPDQFGLAVLDNVDVNGTLVGQHGGGNDHDDDDGDKHDSKDDD